MNDLSSRIKSLLASQPGISASEMVRALGKSQPTISRALMGLGSQVVTIGKGRNTRYASVRRVRDLDAIIPIFLIEENKTSTHAADLIGVSPRGFIVRSKIKEIESKYYPDLPYWMDDLRPSGFLGRLIPKRHPELRYPEDIRYWSADDHLHYLATLAWDTIGNLVVGEHSYTRFNSEKTQALFVEAQQRHTMYPKLADDIIQLGAVGSSAGGEQPKFLAVSLPSQEPVLVKFSPKGNDPLAKRRKELLQMEHIALTTLREGGIAAAESTFLDSDDRSFLELKRFDRVTLNGRIGVISLQALDNQFLGNGGNWRDVGGLLLREGRINLACYEEILVRHYFGLCIANSDMHPGNLSFFCRGEEILDLAPVYDMLPMYYAPVSEQVRPLEFVAPVLLPNDRKYWAPSLQLAKAFWRGVQEVPALQSFSNLSQAWITHLNFLR